jgi:hypothetical protein
MRVVAEVVKLSNGMLLPHIEKLPTGEDDDEGESGVIEENILTPASSIA